ncbi:trehalose operon repressor [Bacillus andreraoultii]|uniref:trehalose operon repressor n=1 Tax=Bacillus andreraoultii TaxID=1499685 RepID=UPI00053B299D|nr:trehalose operon repressor [Bacillus andreraoultii]
MEKKYMQIYRDLAKKIEQGVWPRNSLLPSENDLTEMYGTSRETIRKALNLLSNNGYIQKVRGKGSIVINVHRLSFPVSGIASFKELAEKLGLESKTIVHELGYIDSNEIRNKLQVDVNEKIWHVTRIRDIGGEMVILDKDFFNETFVPLLSKSICEDSIYEYIENHLRLAIGFAVKEIIVEEVTDEDRELLDLQKFEHLVVIRSFVYLDDSSLFQYTESRHRPDKFRFVDFARRVRTS